VVASGAGTLGVPLLNVLVALLVVRLASVERWGEVVPLLLGVQLAAHVAGWGQKEYLLRAFSRAPAQLAAAWQTSLLTRLPLLALAGVLAALLGLPAHQWGLVLLWLLGLVLAQAHEPLVAYRRAFGLALAIDLTTLGLLLAAIAGLAGLAGAAGLTLDWLLLLFALVHLGKAVALLLCFRRTALPGWRGRFAPA
jgi:hypothetical protein